MSMSVEQADLSAVTYTRDYTPAAASYGLIAYWYALAAIASLALV